MQTIEQKLNSDKERAAAFDALKTGRKISVKINYADGVAAYLDAEVVAVRRESQYVYVHQSRLDSDEVKTAQILTGMHFVAVIKLEGAE